MPDEHSSHLALAFCVLRPKTDGSICFFSILHSQIFAFDWRRPETRGQEGASPRLGMYRLEHYLVRQP